MGQTNWHKPVSLLVFNDTLCKADKSGCTAWQAKIEKEAHKEEMRHTHDKGLDNVSNAAARLPSPRCACCET